MTFQTSIHHSFNTEHAQIYGLQEAILIHHFTFWIQFNQRRGKNFHEGCTWTYQTLDDIAAMIPYMTKNEIYETIERLCKGRSRRSKNDRQEFPPVLKKGNFNKSPMDKTTWYAFVNEPTFSNINYEDGECQNGDGECQNATRRMPTPIPDTKPDSLHDDDDSARGCARRTVENVHNSNPEDLLTSEGEKSLSSRKARSSPPPVPAPPPNDGLTESDLYRLALLKKKDWSTDEIKKAWISYSQVKYTVYEPFAYIETIINNQRSLEETRCYRMKKEDIRQQYSTKNFKKKSKTSKESSSEKGTSVNLFANFRPRNAPR